MADIGHGYGSEWHLLRYLGYHRAYLNDWICQGTGASNVTWLDSRFSHSRAPLRDESEYEGIGFCDEAEIIAGWAKYWPQTGSQQNWDAVGRLHYGTSDETDWLLVEAKGHLREARSDCKASSASRAVITSALEETAQRVTRGRRMTAAWLEGYYQYANRLAALRFLMDAGAHGNAAQLLFIYFTGDCRPDSFECPSSVSTWQLHIDSVHRDLDIDPSAPLMKRVHHLYLPVNPTVQSLQPTYHPQG